MDRIPILRMGQYLLVTIQIDLYDRLATNLESDLVQMVNKTGASGVLIDISALTIVHSFMVSILCCNIDGCASFIVWFIK